MYNILFIDKASVFVIWTTGRILVHRTDHFEGVKCLVAMETELNCY
jgi:hypothetical protein